MELIQQTIAKYSSILSNGPQPQGTSISELFLYLFVLDVLELNHVKLKNMFLAHV